MQISIVIPTFNEAERISKLVSYLWEHSGGHVQEIMVVDGGSQDSTLEQARAAGATVLNLNRPSRAQQMNAGAKAASAGILYFVHADSLPPTSFASDILAELKAGYQMGCFRYQFDSPRLLLKFNAWFVRFKWLWCQGGDKTFFIRQEIFWEFDGYDQEYLVMEEYDFLRRAMQKYPLCIIPKNVISSARKYEKNSWLRVQIANATAFSMFRLGMDTRRIRDTYKWFLR